MSALTPTPKNAWRERGYRDVIAGRPVSQLVPDEHRDVYMHGRRCGERDLERRKELARG